MASHQPGVRVSVMVSRLHHPCLPRVRLPGCLVPASTSSVVRGNRPKQGAFAGESALTTRLAGSAMLAYLLAELQRQKLRVRGGCGLPQNVQCRFHDVWRCCVRQRKRRQITLTESIRSGCAGRVRFSLCTSTSAGTSATTGCPRFCDCTATAPVLGAYYHLRSIRSTWKLVVAARTRRWQIR